MNNSPVYVLFLFNVKDKQEYLTYVKRSAKEVTKYQGKVVALGKFRESLAGDIEPRQVFLVVEWESMLVFKDYLNDPELAELHSHRTNGTSECVWHIFDKLEDFRPILK